MPRPAIPGRATEIRYRRTDRRHYRHPFGPGVTMRANKGGEPAPPGSVTLVPRRGTTIHADDRDPGFWDRYGHHQNPPLPAMQRVLHRYGMQQGRYPGESREAYRFLRRLAKARGVPMRSLRRNHPIIVNPRRRRAARGGSDTMFQYLLWGGLIYFLFLRPRQAGSQLGPMAGSESIYMWTDTLTGQVVYAPGIVGPGPAPRWRPASEDEIAAASQG
jgi:hypothetical protein